MGYFIQSKSINFTVNLKYFISYVLIKVHKFNICVNTNMKIHSKKHLSIQSLPEFIFGMSNFEL